jgi:hypothetical protein
LIISNDDKDNHSDDEQDGLAIDLLGATQVISNGGAKKNNKAFNLNDAT